METSLTEYKSPYKNPYILQQFNKKDLKWTKKVTKRYHIVKKLEKNKVFCAQKFFKTIKNPLFALLNRYKKKIHYDFCDSEFSSDFYKKHYTKKDNIQPDISLEYLYVYDILPKEDIYKYREGIIEYSKSCAHLPGVADESYLNDSFNNMAAHNYHHSFHNLRYFVLNDKMLSFKWISDIYIKFEQYGESFYLITYRLKLNEKTTKELKSITTSLVLYDPVFFKLNDKRRISASGNHILSFNRRRAIKDLLLEIEYCFISELNKFVPCFLHRRDIIAPTLGVYKVDGLDDIQKDKMAMMMFDFSSCDYDKSKDSSIIVNFRLLGENESYASLINSSFIEEESALSYLDSYFSPLAEYFVFHSLTPVIEKLIIKNQQKLNKLVTCKSSASKLLKAKIDTLRELNIFKRLITANQKRSTNPFLDDYINEFENCYKECSLIKQYKNSFLLKSEEMKLKYKDFESQINSLYEFYDDNLKAVESSTNIRLVRLTLILTAITLLATLFTILISLNVISFHNTDENTPAEDDTAANYYIVNDR